jgi:hypothetical protein
VFSARAKSIRSVIVDGRVVLDEGRFPHLDEGALLARIDEGAHALWGRMGYMPFPERIDRRPARA